MEDGLIKSSNVFGMEIGVNGVLGPTATRNVGQMGHKAVQGVATILYPTMVDSTAAQETRAAQTPSHATESAALSLHNGASGELGAHVPMVCSHVGLEPRQDQRPVGGDPVPPPIVEATPHFKLRNAPWDDPVVLVVILAVTTDCVATEKAIVTATAIVRETQRLEEVGPVEIQTVEAWVCLGITMKPI